MLSTENQLKFVEQFAEQLNMYHVERDKTNNLIRFRSQTNVLIEIKHNGSLCVTDDFVALSTCDWLDIGIKRSTDHWGVSFGRYEIDICNIKIPLDEGDKLHDDLINEMQNRIEMST
jgi:hypothetical protein